VRSVQTGPLIGLVAALGLLALLADTVGLTVSGWAVGVACAVATNAALASGLVRYDAARLGPADRVTLGRATLVAGVAALTAESFAGPAPVQTLVMLTAVALVLDAVDGWVARRTETASALGARFDMEVDALLILILSAFVARSTGAWVLAIGGARYAFIAAGCLLPWLRESLPPRHWRRVVAATVGVVLVCAAANILPRLFTEIALAVSLGLLVESFGRDVRWLWQTRVVQPGGLVISAGRRNEVASV
jgi:phosphatidylglycerophosphate synthase